MLVDTLPRGPSAFRLDTCTACTLLSWWEKESNFLWMKNECPQGKHLWLKSPFSNGNAWSRNAPKVKLCRRAPRLRGAGSTCRPVPSMPLPGKQARSPGSFHCSSLKQCIKKIRIRGDLEVGGQLNRLVIVGKTNQDGSGGFYFFSRRVWPKCVLRTADAPAETMRKGGGGGAHIPNVGL